MYETIIERRSSEVGQRRLDLSGAGAPKTSSRSDTGFRIIYAYCWPFLQLSHAAGPEWKSYTKIISSVANSPRWTSLISAYYDPVASVFLGNSGGPCLKAHGIIWRQASLHGERHAALPLKRGGPTTCRTVGFSRQRSSASSASCCPSSPQASRPSVSPNRSTSREPEAVRVAVPSLSHSRWPEGGTVDASLACEFAVILRTGVIRIRFRRDRLSQELSRASLEGATAPLAGRFLAQSAMRIDDSTADPGRCFPDHLRHTAGSTSGIWKPQREIEWDVAGLYAGLHIALFRMPRRGSSSPPECLRQPTRHAGSRGNSRAAESAGSRAAH